MLELYQTLVSEKSRLTFQMGKPEQIFAQSRGLNRLCGDEVFIYCSGEKTQPELWYECKGCAICKASCAVLIESQNLRPLVAIKASVENFLNFNDDFEEPVKTLLTAKNFPARFKCVTLAWQTLKSCLDENSKKDLYVTTE